METPTVPTPLVPVSWGELIDKITILQIKAERLTDAGALANVARELAALNAAAATIPSGGEVEALRAELLALNRRLWDVEDAIREKEAGGAFDAEFIALARAVYRNNDERAAIKRRISLALGSALVEEKRYAGYGRGPRS